MSDREMFNQLLQELKQLREEKGVSLEEISKKTRLRLSYLKDLEAGNLEQLPEVYDRFIFKTYLQFLGVEDQQKYLNALEKLRVKHTTTIIRQTPASQQKGLSINLDWINGWNVLKTFYLVVPLAIIITLIVVLYRYYSQNETIASVPVKELTAQEIVKQSEPPEPVVTEPPKLKVTVETTDKCWILIIKDHADTSDVTLNARVQHKIEADSVLEFRIGNPSAIVLKTEKQTYRNLAAPGQVISYLKLTRQGIVKKRVVIPKKQKVAKNDTIQAN